MAEIARVIKQGRSLYVAIPPRILGAVGWKVGDRVAMITDGRTVAVAKVPLEEIVNRALMQRALAMADGR